MKRFLAAGFFFTLSLVLVLTLVTPAKAEVIASDNPRVTLELPLGKLEGEERKSLHGKKFYAFEGVPYAAPPTGENRFKEPQEVQKWNGTKVVNSQRIQCTQYNEFVAPMPPYLVIGDEDCLIMNIYSPNLSQKANLDVIVFIHEGAFMVAAGFAATPDYLLDEDVIFITFNHRLGPLGYLSTEDEVVPGNMGMLDQLEALKFVQKYVKYFGGNPKTVTFAGDSSGAASVHFHMISPRSRSKGLFNKAIMHTGTMLSPWSLMENPLEKTKKIAALLNCTSSSMQKAVDCLRTKSADDVAGTAKEFIPWMFVPAAPFGIVIDSWAKNPSLPEHPLKLIQQGKVDNVPMIFSHTNSEGLLPGCDYYYELILNQVDTQWNDIVPHILDYNYTVKPSLRDSVSQQIRKQYMGNKAVNTSTFMDLIQIITDRMYIRDVVKAVKLHLEYVPKSSIQFYFFTYRGAESQCNKRTSYTHEDFGAAHIDDASYAVSTDFVKTSSTHMDREMIKVMVKMYVSFARNGTADVGLDWPIATKEKLNRLHIAGPHNLTIDTIVFTNESFWASLPLMENENLFKSGN